MGRRLLGLLNGVHLEWMSAVVVLFSYTDYCNALLPHFSDATGRTRDPCVVLDVACRTAGMGKDVVEDFLFLFGEVHPAAQQRPALLAVQYRFAPSQCRWNLS